ncbi:MAG TPA: LysM peptidoglycan-binding domain-containing protein [Candidatus Saccharimonadales bacterium]
MASSQAIKQSLFARHKNTSHREKSGISSTKIGIYVSVFALLVGVIAIGYQTPEKAGAQLNQAANVGSAVIVANEDEKRPSVDEIVATDVAAGLAERTNLSIAPTVASAAVSLSAKSEIAQTSDEVIVKPQIVQSSVKSRDISSYVAKKGDTVPKIAEKYNVSENTIRWANNLEADVVPKGKKLRILPVNGVLHTVKSGESLKAIAKMYGTEEARIVSYNDLELKTAKKGQKLLIPGGILPESRRPGYQAPVSPSQGFGSDFNVVSENVRATAGNRYAPGYCTWYVYERRAADGNEIGSFWGNAVTWGGNARAAGFTVNNSPSAGAILQTGNGGGGYGHVAYVERVDGKGNVYLREMNYAGFNVVSARTIPASQARSYTYIH